MSADLGTVENRSFSISNFCLQNGNVMPTARIVYETYGRLATDGKNAALITHGYTSSHHGAGRNPVNGNLPGWWDGLIGPGKAIDTEKLFVVSSNMLGSSFGSTNGASINPRTGQPYGPDFPAITVRDIVAAERALLDELGVKHLVAVAGPSYGGYQAFQWAVAYPDLMDAIVPVVTAPKAQDAERGLAELQNRLAADPEWNDGRYYDRGGAKTVLTELRVEMLKRNGLEAALAPRYPDHAARGVRSADRRSAGAQRWDTNSLVILRRGTISYDTAKDFAKIKAKVLYVLCRTDRLFPPSIAPGVMQALAAPPRRGPLFRDRQRSQDTRRVAPTCQMVASLRDFLAPLLAKLN
jgi:homoserine O-acetyltransferase